MLTQYMEMLQKGAGDNNLPFPEIPDENVLETMLRQGKEMLAEWNALDAGASLHLEFLIPGE